MLEALTPVFPAFTLQLRFRSVHGYVCELYRKEMDPHWRRGCGIASAGYANIRFYFFNYHADSRILGTIATSVNTL
jgi:hypothetical protein